MSDLDETRPGDGPDASETVTPTKKPHRPKSTQQETPEVGVPVSAVSMTAWNGKVHPLAESFPNINGKQLDELQRDIAENGLAHPIVLDQHGTLVDGRQRLSACQAAGVEPTFRVLPADTDVVAYIVSANQHRRHSTAGQRAAAALAIKSFIDEEPRNAGGRPSKDPGTKKPARNDGQVSRHQRTSASKAAAITGASESSIYKFEALQQESPELAEKVKQGEKSLSAATREAKPRTTKAEARQLRLVPAESDDGELRNSVTVASLCSYVAVQRAEKFRELWHEVGQALTADEQELLLGVAGDAVMAWIDAAADVEGSGDAIEPST